MNKQKKQALVAGWYVAALVTGFVFSDQILGMFE